MSKWTTEPADKPDPSSLGEFLSNLKTLQSLFEAQLAAEQANLLKAQQELERLEAQAKRKKVGGSNG